MKNGKTDKIHTTTLSSASKSKYFKKKVNIKCIVTGKTLLPYYIPKHVKVLCKPTTKCRNCIISEDPYIDIDYRHQDFIKFVGVTDTQTTQLLKIIAGIPYKCSIKTDTESVYTVEEIFLSPMITGLKNVSTSFVSRIGYYIGYGIDCNVPYSLECYNVPEPKQQKIVHVIVGAERLKTNVDSFEMTSKLGKKLKIFNPKDNTSEFIYDKLEELYEIYSKNVTKIFHRFDLHMAIDLIFHSPLSFYFNGEFVKKGWGDAIIIGDTRCGKGFVAENLCKYYNIGDVVSGENLSFAGLVGGTQQLDNKWVITWGKIPLNDKQLLIIDEAGEMEEKDFARLSRVRSEGIAEITKIQSEKALARTRLIFLANPKNRIISSYTFGIESLSDVVGNPEDISRFDYALIVANDEVSLKDINKSYSTVKNPYEKLDPLLVMWCWSRSPKQIKFTDTATKLILNLAIKLGNTYAPQIPLIQGENIRIKLAKISVMIAGRLYSADKIGRAHV